MNLTGFLGSKKAIGLLSTQTSIVVIVVTTLIVTQADPEKLQAAAEFVKWACGAVAAAGAAYMGVQGSVDKVLAVKPADTPPKT